MLIRNVCAALSRSIPRHDLRLFDEFEAAGVVGVRVNLTGNLPVRFVRVRRVGGSRCLRCVRRNWHIEINDRCARLHESRSAG